MTTPFKIKKIIINDFKLFGKKNVINFECNDLVVFDGPNGHGKTSVYDAIELAITGDIRRLYLTESQQTPKDVVVAHKNSINCSVTIELYNGERSIIIERKLKKNIPNQDKKISNFKNLWELKLIDSASSKNISQFELNSIVGNIDLPRDFNLFHYVEQEDTAHFLKSKKEKERAEALSVLFGDTLEMQGSVKKIENIIGKIDPLIKERKKTRERLEVRGNINALSSIKPTPAKYSRLLNWPDNIFDFDKVDLTDINIERKESYLLNINRINWINKYKEHFLLQWKHKLICEKNDLLKGFILHSNYIHDFSKLKINANNKWKVNNILSFLSIDNYTKTIENKDLNHVLDLVGLKDKDLFVAKLKSISDGINNNNKCNELILDVLVQRARLKKYLSESANEDHCILCGNQYNNHDDLIEHIDRKEIIIRELLSNEENRIYQDKELFFENEITELSKLINSYIKDLAIVSDKHLESLGKVSNNSEKILKLKSWLDENSIIYIDLLNQFQFNMPYDEVIDSNLVELKRRIMAKVSNVPPGYDDIDEEIHFDNVFKLYFNSTPQILRKITEEEISAKIDYINARYIESISNDIKEYDTITSELVTLEHKKERLTTLKKSLNTSISRYQKRLIKDIEIPFYIYSGKVLQSHQSGKGNGIFIKDKTGGEELKNIRLVSDWNSDHDVINTMSSGQIAATVISLYLALNKVYAKGFSPILIDDPVQTMDEINMISLVELLRNEFSNRQIVLSTHEDHVSKYFIYKFLKYRKSVRQIRLLEMKEYQLTNNH
ncbi:recombination protein F [compost metagenome]